MIVGVRKERKQDEYRVALTPAAARELVAYGHQVLIERGAGVGASFDDDAFLGAGAVIVETPDEVFSEAELVLGVKEPIAEEYPRLSLRKDQVFFTYLHLAADKACTEALLRANNTAIAYETVATDDGRLPLLMPMSEVAGRMAPFVAAHHLMRPGGGHGALICGLPGVSRAKVVILGAGVAGRAAATIAVGMHADVTILDKDIERLRQMDHDFRGALGTVASSAHAIEEVCIDADVVIGAVLIVGAKAPKLIDDDLVQKMPNGSVLVDISVDQGGCFASSRPTTHSDPTFRVANSIFYCVANMPGAVPHSATQALVNATLPFTLAIASFGWKQAVLGDRTLARGVNVSGGNVVCAPVAEAHGLHTVSLTTLLG